MQYPLESQHSKWFRFGSSPEGQPSVELETGMLSQLPFSSYGSRTCSVQQKQAPTSGVGVAVWVAVVVDMDVCVSVTVVGVAVAVTDSVSVIVFVAVRDSV